MDRFECPIERRQTVETTRESDVGDPNFAIRQQRRRCCLNAAVQQMRLRAHAHEFRELKLKIPYAHRAGFGQGGDGEWLVKSRRNHLQRRRDSGDGARAAILFCAPMGTRKTAVQFVEEQHQQGAKIRSLKAISGAGFRNELAGERGNRGMRRRREDVFEIWPAKAFGFPSQSRCGMGHEQSRRLQEKPSPAAARAWAAAAAVKLPVRDDCDVSGSKGEYF